MIDTKALPPLGEYKVSVWYRFKEWLESWLRAHAFPPNHRQLGLEPEEGVDLDDLFNGKYEEREAIVKKRFPVKFRLQRAWEWITRWPRIDNAWYWVRTHTYNRYHILDLRQSEPENPEGYRWGYLEPSDQMQLAMFLCLRRYWEHGNPIGGGL